MGNTVVTCVYCGMKYPDGTPTHKSELLTEHIKVCPMHPMRTVESKVREMREDIKYLLHLMPEWAKVVPLGLPPEFYGTGSYEEDLEINSKLCDIANKYGIE